jgi:transcriptional regulator with XRE-family HTH domain
MKKIGGKIRKDRVALGLSIRTLAEKVGISPMTLHRIEKGQTSPSVALLSDIAYQLNQPVISFIEDKRNPVVHIKAGDQSRAESSNLKLRILAPKGLIDRDISVSLCEARKGRFVNEHKNEGHEWVFIISGKCLFEHNKNTIELNPGDSLYFDSRFPHSVTALSKLEFFTIYFGNR